jgi:hypothetical protein
MTKFQQTKIDYLPFKLKLLVNALPHPGTGQMNWPFDWRWAKATNIRQLVCVEDIRTYLSDKHHMDIPEVHNILFPGGRLRHFNGLTCTTKPFLTSATGTSDVKGWKVKHLSYIPL